MLENEPEVIGEYCFVSALNECKDLQGLLLSRVHCEKYVVV